MKSKQEEKPLKLLIDKLLIAYGLENKINERKLVVAWENITGKMISRHTREIYLKKDVLYVKLDSAPLRQELTYAREKLIQDLNQSAEKRILNDIVFL